MSQSTPPSGPASQAPAATPTLLRFARIAIVLAIVAALVAIVSGPGNRFGWWDYRRAFTILGWASGGGMIAALASMAVLVWAAKRQAWRPLILAAVALLIGAMTFILPFPLQWRTNAPSIHDISTDTEQPPVFRALAFARANAPNGVDYGGPAVAAEQKKAYPDIVPLTLAARPEQALNQCLQVARAMDWSIADGSITPLGFEATETTVFFGFRDDIIVRLTPVGASGQATRVDVRSVSRVGRGDHGVNARRIREFFRLLSRTPIKTD